MTAAMPEAALATALGRHASLAIAVSGGVDSMLLAFLAHRLPHPDVTVFHAVSPAVPGAATDRVRRFAGNHGWFLHLIDAAELLDPRYRANPVNRCYFCKTNLYARIRSATNLTIASGTNTDDLGDYRPGLQAATEHGVVHPFVEAGLAKADIYALARAYQLPEIASLPAQPCLASRLETGTGVDSSSLRFVEVMEAALQPLVPGASALRCRIGAAGVHVECEPAPDTAASVIMERMATDLCDAAGRRFLGLRCYRRGSAFLRAPS